MEADNFSNVLSPVPVTYEKSPVKFPGVAKPAKAQSLSFVTSDSISKPDSASPLRSSFNKAPPPPPVSTVREFIIVVFQTMDHGNLACFNNYGSGGVSHKGMRT